LFVLINKFAIIWCRKIRNWLFREESGGIEEPVVVSVSSDLKILISEFAQQLQSHGVL
jgi:hypothetical protein